MEYRVELDVYNGPMDLLLYLIKRDELDIYDIPIHRITESYMQYVHMLQQMSRENGLDINVAGEFLVTAATLMEIKSALLLPRTAPPTTNPDGTQATPEDITDPRYELVQKLLEYKRFKDTAMVLEQKAAIHSQRFPRFPAALVGDPTEPPPLDMEEVQIWDLLETFNRLMREVGTRKNFHEVVYDDTPIDLHAADIEDRLAREGKLSLRALILGRKSKSEMIGVFLAILELTRQKKILVAQTEALDDIEIVAASEEHQKTYTEAMLNQDNKDTADEPSLFDAVAPAPSAEQKNPDQQEDDEDEYDEDEDEEGGDEYDDEDDDDFDDSEEDEDELEEPDTEVPGDDADESKEDNSPKTDPEDPGK